MESTYIITGHIKYIAHNSRDNGRNETNMSMIAIATNAISVGYSKQNLQK